MFISFRASNDFGLHGGETWFLTFDAYLKALRACVIMSDRIYEWKSMEIIRCSATICTGLPFQFKGNDIF